MNFYLQSNKAFKILQLGAFLLVTEQNDFDSVTEQNDFDSISW